MSIDLRDHDAMMALDSGSHINAPLRPPSGLDPLQDLMARIARAASWPTRVKPATIGGPCG
jgi:hypothetical protein